MKKIYFVLAGLLIIASCKKEPSVENSELNNSKREKTIVYNLKNGGQVTVFIDQSGQYIVGGDVVLSKEQIAYLEGNKLGNEANPRSTFTSEFQKLWPAGIIYYKITDIGNSTAINNAIAHWQSNTPIRFIQRTNQANYVDFAGQPTQGGGDSQLGMVGGRQEIRLVSNVAFTTVVHEIGHAVGLMHEQTRADRDQFININYSNIQFNWTSQYAIYNPGTGFQIGPFDYQSVMVYPSYAGGDGNPAYPGNTTPQMTRKNGTTWDQGYQLSSGDIDGVNYLYNNGIYVKDIMTENDEKTYQNQDDAGFFYYNSVEFYSDPNFQNRISITKPIVLNVKFSYIDIWNNPFIDQNLKISVPAGANGIYLGESKKEYRIDYGNYVSYYESNYVVKPGIGYSN